MDGYLRFQAATASNQALDEPLNRLGVVHQLLGLVLIQPAGVVRAVLVLALLPVPLRPRPRHLQELSNLTMDNAEEPAIADLPPARAPTLAVTRMHTTLNVFKSHTDADRHFRYLRRERHLRYGVAL